MFTPEKIDHLRSQTPGVKTRIHLNNAGASLMPDPVIQAIMNHIQLEATIGGYEAAEIKQEEIRDFYPTLAQLLNAKASNIAFTTNATDSYNKALSSVPFKTGDTILTTINDYASNQIAFMQLQKHFGLKIVRAKDLPEGGVDVNSMDLLIKEHRPCLVAVTHVPSNSGLVQEVEKIGEICHEAGILYLVDACQSAGQMPLDVQKIHCDFLSATFRKFLRGPRGAGFLYVSDRVLKRELSPLFLDLHSAAWDNDESYTLAKDATRFELWERPYALMLAAKEAVTYALDLGLEPIRDRINSLAAYGREQLESLKQIRVLDKGNRKCAIISLTSDTLDAATLKGRLDKALINSSVASGDNARFDFAEKKAGWALRISPHYYNTKEEIDQAVKALIV